MGIRFRARKTIRLGPLRLHFTEHGYTGWSLKVWRWTYSHTTGAHSFDTPGPGGLHWGGGRRRRRTR